MRLFELMSSLIERFLPGHDLLDRSSVHSGSQFVFKFLHKEGIIEVLECLLYSYQ